MYASNNVAESKQWQSQKKIIEDKKKLDKGDKVKEDILLMKLK